MERVEQPRHTVAIAQRAERPARLFPDPRILVLQPGDQRGRRAAVAQRAETPGGLFTYRRFAIAEGVDEQRHPARIAERPERPRRVAAREPDRAAERAGDRIECTRPGRDERGGRLLTRRRNVAVAAAPVAIGLADVRFERRRIVHERDQRRDRLGGPIAQLAQAARRLGANRGIAVPQRRGELANTTRRRLLRRTGRDESDRDRCAARRAGARIALLPNERREAHGRTRPRSWTRPVAAVVSSASARTARSRTPASASLSAPVIASNT